MLWYRKFKKNHKSKCSILYNTKWKKSQLLVMSWKANHFSKEMLSNHILSQNKCFQNTYLLDWAPLKLVSMTINEKITPEKPIEHSFMKNVKGWMGLLSINKATIRWRIALVVESRIIRYRRRKEPIILSNSEPRGTNANMLKTTWSKDAWKRTDV